MKIYTGIRCTNCASVMFPFSIGPNNSIGYTCPRGCQFGYLHNLSYYLNTEQIQNIYTMLNPEMRDYEAQCHRCKEVIDARNPAILRDIIPSLGFMCPHCKDSLRSFYTIKGLISSHHVFIPPQAIYYILCPINA